MSVKEVLENYFTRLESSYQNKNGCMPKTVYAEKCDLHGIYIKGSLTTKDMLNGNRYYKINSSILSK